MMYSDISNKQDFNEHDVEEIATVPKYGFLPRFFDTVFCHYRVYVYGGWITVSKDTFFQIRSHRYAFWKMGGK